MKEITTRKPQVVLIGNGLIRSFGDSPSSWQDLLEKLTVSKYKGKVNLNVLPNPLQIILRTAGEVNSTLTAYKDMLKGKPVKDELAERIRRIYNAHPDHILTTNYSYEIESAVLGKTILSDNKLYDLQIHTSEVSRCEGQYMLHTCINAGGIPVWHIHGEARKPKSIIIGHYWYGSLLAKYKKMMDDRKDRYKRNEAKGCYEVQSWLDAFIMGDVYVLGFGFDVSEMDLWWLLNRKQREQSNLKGKLYYYSNEDTGKFIDKEELLKVCGAEVIYCSDLNMSVPAPDEKYKVYCDAAITDICERIRKS